MKKLLLINPVGRRTGTLLNRFSTYPPLGLAYVAAVTPPHWDVQILDENFDRFAFQSADLVGITAFTSSINRAYEIAAVYRERGIKVIMGGIHVSMLPEEALQYADSVVVGEVEDIWAKVIDDFEKNRLAARYEGPRVDLERRHVKPRRELLHPNYLWHAVQTSRGCPFNCHFCSVSRYLGRHYRQRCADEVLAEIAQIDGEYLYFMDDNLVGYSEESKARAKALFKGMIERGITKKWFMQSSINIGEDEEVIELAARAGCIYVFIGFETISESSLKLMKKGINLKIGIKNYESVVRSCHRNGIAVLGAFIIGNDYESPEYYKALAEFITRSGIDIVQITILTPLPGTELMEKLQAENRLIYTNFPEDWDKYRFSYVVHQPEGIDTDTIYMGNNYIKHHIYSFPNYQFRSLKSLASLKSLPGFFVSLKTNQAYKRGWKNAHYFAKYPVNKQLFHP